MGGHLYQRQVKVTQPKSSGYLGGKMKDEPICEICYEPLKLEDFRKVTNLNGDLVHDICFQEWRKVERKEVGEHYHRF